MRTAVLVLTCVALGFGLSSWKFSTVKAQAPTAEKQDADNITTGRFQLVHAYYSTARQGTFMIDSKTGRVFELATGKDKDGKEMAVFQQAPISFCIEPTCTADYGWSLRPVSLDRITTPPNFDPTALKNLER
jgi:hypothetical protein